MNKLLKLAHKAFLSNFNSLMYPYKLTFAITYNCNHKCKHCNIWKKNPGKELSKEEIETFMKKFPYFEWINLTGGEPFLRKDFVKIVKSFAKKNRIYLLNTTTNGFNPSLITKKVLKVLSFKIPLNIIVVSLDGYKKLHEMIRGVPGSFDNAIETFKSLREISEENRNFKVFFGYTINPLNIGKFKKTFLEVKKKIKNLCPRDFHFNLYHTSKHYYENFGSFGKEAMENYDKKLKEELELISFLKGSLRNPITFLEKMYVEFAKKYVREKRTPLRCKALQSSLFIDPEGNVFPCTILDFKIGNLRESNYDLKEILDQGKKELEKIIRGLKCPNCWTPCEAYQTILGNLGKIILRR